MPAARQKAKEQPINYQELGNRGIWQLIRKGLSGREAALLWIRDSWEVDDDREGFLSEKNLERLEKAVKYLPPTEAEVYQKYTYAYRLLDYTLLEAEKKSLIISRDIYKFINLAWQVYLQAEIRLLLPLVRDHVTIDFTAEPGEEVPNSLEEALELFLDNLGTIRASRALFSHLGGQEIQAFFQRTIAHWKKELASFRAYETVILALGEILELPVEEELSSFRADIEGATANYDALILSDIAEVREELPKELKLPKIHYEKIKPEPEELDYLRERIAMAFGDRWMEEGPDIAKEEEGLELEEEWEDLYGQ
jgi:hypothetical protein